MSILLTSATARRSLTGLAALAAAGTGLVATPAAATPTAACSNQVGLVTANGHHGIVRAISTRPPTTEGGIDKDRIFQPGTVRLASTASSDPIDEENTLTTGAAVIGDALYGYNYTLDEDGRLTDPPSFGRIGGGWGQYKTFEISVYAEGLNYSRARLYGISKNGVLTRWGSSAAPGWNRPVSMSGFSNVKAMALISKTRTYDTFLITRTTGALQTVRIPLTSPLRPVIKTVRARSWQGFESLVLDRCGNGTVLTAIDKDSKTAYQYALSKANGTSTVVQSIGKVPGSFDAPVYFRWGPIPGDDVLTGE